MGFTSLMEDLLKRCEDLQIPESNNSLDNVTMNFYNHSLEIRKDALGILKILNKDKSSKRGLRIFEVIKKENKLNSVLANYDKLRIKYNQLKGEIHVKVLNNLITTIESQRNEITRLTILLEDKEEKRLTLNGKIAIKSEIEKFKRNNDEIIQSIDSQLTDLLFMANDLTNNNYNHYQIRSSELIEDCINKLKQITSQ